MSAPLDTLLSYHAPDAALFAVRETLGLFFAISGYHKVFDPVTHPKIAGFFKKLGVGWAVWPVTLGELFGGLGLILGFFTPLAVLGLLVIMAGAFKLDTWAVIKAKQPHDACDWVSKTICTPESLLILGLIATLVGGLNPLSLDAILINLI